MIPKRIILHHSAGKDNNTLDLPAIRREHILVRNWKNVGYHFILDKVAGEYEVLLGRMFNEVGAHCAGENHDSLGICLLGNFSLTHVPAAQFMLAVKLCKSLRATFGIPASQIFGHRELAATECPGTNFDLDLFRREVMRVER